MRHILTPAERQRILVLNRQGLTTAVIAQRMSRCRRSTISKIIKDAGEKTAFKQGKGQSAMTGPDACDCWKVSGGTRWQRACAAITFGIQVVR